MREERERGREGERERGRDLQAVERWDENTPW